MPEPGSCFRSRKRKRRVVRRLRFRLRKQVASIRLFVTLQEEVFEQPDERGQTLIVPVAAGIELRDGDTDQVLRPGSIDQPQQELWTEAKGQRMRHRWKKRRIEHVTID